jgi:hypothetical protein
MWRDRFVAKQLEYLAKSFVWQGNEDSAVGGKDVSEMNREIKSGMANLVGVRKKALGRAAPAAAISSHKKARHAG